MECGGGGGGAGGGGWGGRVKTIERWWWWENNSCGDGGGGPEKKQWKCGSGGCGGGFRTERKIKKGRWSEKTELWRRRRGTRVSLKLGLLLEKLRIAISIKYHAWYLSQISLLITLLPILI